MSVTTHANLVLGKLFDDFFPTKKGRIRGCSHEIEDSYKFCIECGSPAWVWADIPLPGFNKDGEPEDERFYFYSQEFNTTGRGIFGISLGKVTDINDATEISKVSDISDKKIKELSPEIIEILKRAGYVDADLSQIGDYILLQYC